MSIFIGIDGGGTKTTCAVGDDTTVLGSARAGGSNVVRVGEEQARASLHAAILKACQAARVDAARVERTCIGVAGASLPQVCDAVRRFISEIVPGEVIVLGDNEVALEAAFSGGSGVIVASGTGSIAYGRNEQGRTARAGGHGFAISDEGSGHWIGREAVAAIMRAFDREHESDLQGCVERAWHVSGREQLVKTANATPPPDFARLFPAVLQAAESGDTFAVEVLKDAGSKLAELAVIVIEKLWPANASVRVGTIGGVFQRSSIVRQEFCNALSGTNPLALVSVTVVDPAKGALALARKGIEQVASAQP